MTKTKEFFSLVFVFFISLLSGLHPILSKYINSWCYIIPVGLLMLSLGCYLYFTGERDVQLTNVLRNFLKEPPGKEFKKWYRYAGIVIFLGIVFQVSWIFDSVRDISILLLQTHTPDLLNHHIFTLLLSIGFLLLLPLVYIRFIYKRPVIPKDDKPLPRKVLILALSTPRPEEQIEELKKKLQEIDQQTPSEEDFKDLSMNWIPALRAILYKTEHLENVYVLTSPQAEEYFEKFKEFLMTVGVLKDRITSGALKIHKVTGIDANDFASVKRVLEYLVSSKLSRYHDRDISFNLTGGTAIISSAMILEAVHGDRQAEYIKQSSNVSERNLIRIDVSERDVALNE